MRTSRKILHASLAVVAGVVAAGASVGAASPVHAWATQATVLPELQEVTARTTTRSMATATEPAGSTVTFPFDEPLDEATPPDPADFTLYDVDGNVHPARDVVVAGDTVTAWFPDLDTVEALNRISLGAVAESAVRDLDGGANPLGWSYLLRTWTYQTTGLQGCPTLRRVTNVQVLRRSTRADFLFECDKSPDGSPDSTKFHLQLVDGAIASGIDQRRSMRGDLAVVTIWFPGRHPARTIARGTVDRDAVWWDYSNHDDPMGEGFELYYHTGIQAGSVSHQGNTVRPDLVRVSLQPSPRPGRPDHAVFVFDQKVTSPRAGRFRLYPDGTGTRAVRLKARPRRVRVTFAADSLTDTRQASVAAGAVRGGRADEVGVTNTLTESSTTSRYTAGPDLTSWGFDKESSVPRALFSFDADLVGDPRPSAFSLYTQAGERLGAELCTIEPPSFNGSMLLVGCTFPGATREEVDSGAIGLATVEAGAVYDANGRTNPPGSM